MNHTKYLLPKDLEREVKDTKFNINHLLKHNGYQNQPLSFDQAYFLGAFSLSPYVSELQDVFQLSRESVLVQSVAALCTLHNQALYTKEGSAEQIAGICAAVFDYDIGTSSSGFLIPRVDEVIDNCGMGGDLFRTPNLSTIAALIASASGVKMLKHGSPGNTDNIGSSDFLLHCGVNLFPIKEKIEEAVEKINFGYTDALDSKYKRIHQQTHEYAKLAHMNDIIGPITNPVNPKLMKKRIIGINHLVPPERVAEAYQILNQKGITDVNTGLFIRGFCNQKRNGGIDEVSIMPGGTKVAELYGSEIRVYDLFAKDFRLKEISSEELNPGNNKAETSRKILSGEILDRRVDAAVVNAAIIFYLTERLNLKEGTEKAREILKSGRPYQLLQDYAKFSHGGE